MGRVQIAPVVGKASGKRWSQVLVRPGSSGAGELRLEAGKEAWLIALTVVEGGGKTADVVGDGLVETLTEKVTAQESLQVLQKERGLESAVLVVFKGRAIKMYGYGGGRAVLWRDGELGLAMKAHAGWEAKEGEWQVGDRWLVGTDGLVGEMSRQLVEEIMEHSEAQQASEELVTRVLAAEENSGVAGWMVYGIEGNEDDTRGEEVAEAGDNDEMNHEKLHKQAPEPLNDVKEKTARPTVYLRVGRNKRKRVLLTGLVVLVVLAVSVVVGQRKREEQQWQAKYTAVIQATDGLMQQAQAQAESNPVGAAETAKSAEQQLEAAMNAFASQPTYQQQLTAQLTKAKQVYTQVSGQELLAQVPVWFDLSIAKDGFFGDSLAVSDTNVVVLDKTHGLLMEVDYESKQTELVGGGSLLGGAKLLAASGGRGIVLSTSGLIDLTLAKKTAGVLVEPDNAWQQPVALGLFAGNVYLLDAGAGTIWQYPGLAAGVGTRRMWVTDKQVNLNNAVDMAIDGDIWVLSKTGEVSRLRRGEAMDFAISGLKQGMQEPVAIDTNADVDSLYILDRGNNRLVVVSKEGQYEKQVVWQGFSGVSDITVVGNPSVVMAVSGSSLYRISLE